MFARSTSGPSRGIVHRFGARALALGLVLAPALSAQGPGTVLNERKFSNGGQIMLDDGDQFGRAVVGLGDVDGDGNCDLAIGAQADDDGGTMGQTSDVGAVYLLFLNEQGGLRAQQKISDTVGGFTGGLDDRDFFGKAVASLDDLDGDGVPDLAVGASRDDDGGTSRGAVWILFLNNNGTVKSHAKISDTQGGLSTTLKDLDEFGSSIGNLGDVDGDGVVDLIVGARLDDTGGNARGAVYILFLNADGSVKDEQKISSSDGGFVGPLRNDDSFGQAATGIGDLDGDGIPDAAVGATKDDDGGFRNGAIWILFLNRDGTVKAEQKISALAGGFVGPLTGSDEFGNGISGLGDLDGDGVIDLAVGAIFDKEVSGISEGAVWILFMNPDGTVKAEQKINELHGGFDGEIDDGGEFGESVYSVGDLNSDGIAELAVGERFKSDGGAGRGAVWLLYMDGNPTYPAVPDFDVSTTGGFWPRTVDFTDTSSGDVRRWTWDFGDGAQAFERNPQHVYTAAGTYSVSLTVQTPCKAFSTTKTDLLVITDPLPPEADFSASPLSAKAGDSIDFTDLSSGSITDWAWDFGDGGTSSEAEPTYVYLVSGTYTVALTTTGPLGSDTETKVDYLVIDVPDTPNANFSASTQMAVAGTLIDFIDLSTGVVTEWAWDFGDGAVASEQNPTHAYLHPGTYDVSLTVSSEAGFDTESKPDFQSVLVPPPPQTAFSFAPATVNVGDLVQFTDQSGGQVLAWNWDFGDGSTSTLQNPTHVFTSPGVRMVILKASNDGGTQGNFRLVLVLGIDGTGSSTGFDTDLQVPKPQFSADDTIGAAPLIVSFGDQTPGPILAWSWDFGDGSTSSEQHPTHTYTAVGTFDVALTASSAFGDGTTVKEDFIVVLPDPPSANFGADLTAGVTPLAVQFNDLSTGVANAWSWSFGDGGSSSLQNPLHIFTFAGSFNVSLLVSGPGGSDSVTKLDFIVVLDAPPVADFASDVQTGASPLTVFFTELATGVVDTYVWDLGDGTQTTTPNPNHVYATPGTYTVTLTVTGPGGSDGETKTNYIRATGGSPPDADFDADLTAGLAPLDVQFTDLTSGPVGQWAWDFGDGGSASEQHPSHSYVTAGTYTVALTATGPGGVDVLSKVDFIVAVDMVPSADFSADVTLGDAPLDVSFSDASSGVVSAWSWDFGDGAESTQEDPLHAFHLPGTYSVALTVTGPGGQDTESKPDYVVANTPPAPVAEFTSDTTTGDAPLAVQFTDLTTGQVDAWAWDFGDGGTASLQHPAYVYLAAGTYTVTLSATGLGGTDVETKAGYVVVTSGLQGGSGGLGRAPRPAPVPAPTPARAHVTRRNGTGRNPLWLQADGAPFVGETWTLRLADEALASGTAPIWFLGAEGRALALNGGELLLDPEAAFLWLGSRTGDARELALAIPPEASLAGAGLSVQVRLVGADGRTRWTNAVDALVGGP